MGRYLGSRTNEEFLSLDKSQGKHPETSSTFSNPCRRWLDELISDIYCLPKDRSIDAWISSFHSVRDLPPTSVHAYKSRQSRIPSDGLSRERSGGTHGDARRSPLRREFCSLHANGRHLLWEKRAPYEYVKWESKRKKRKRYERSKDNGVGMRNDRFTEKRK